MIDKATWRNKLADWYFYHSTVCRWYRHISANIHCRMIHTHYVRVPDMKPGQWRDTDHRMEGVLFELFAQYVEGEEGHLHDEDYYREQLAKGEYVHPNIRAYLGATKEHRRQNKKYWRGLIALAHFDWEAHLDDPNSPYGNFDEYNKPEDFTSQAEYGRKFAEIYKWYRDVYLTWQDPFQREFNGQKHVDGTDNFSSSEHPNRLNKPTPEYMAFIKECAQLDEEYHNKMTEMMKLIVEYRRGMWT